MNSNDKKWNVILAATAIFAALSVAALSAGLILRGFSQIESTEATVPAPPAEHAIMESFDATINTALADAHAAVRAVSRVFWLEENTIVAPQPNPLCYGQTNDPASLQWLLDAATEIMAGQQLVFHPNIEIAPDSKITYYLDQSILVITWHQVLDDYFYTFCEVKITHPSQFRRYLACNEYNSDYTHPVSKMADMVNAVVASSADYYRGRNHGIIVYDGIVYQTEHSDVVDTCFIDKNGDMILVKAGKLSGVEETQAYVDEHEIDFSLAFGPILVKDGKRCDPKNYYLGEINDGYARVALCQQDKLHYVTVLANSKDSYLKSPTMREFTNHIEALGCQMAYALDGGHTGTLTMQGRVLNPLRRSQRWVSDIIYFATAIPSKETDQP